MIVHKRVITSIVLVSLAAVGLVAGVAVPSALSVSGIRKQITDRKAEIDERVDMVKHIRESLTNRKIAGERLRLLSRMAVHEGDELSFVTSLESVAAKAGLEQDISLETVNQKELSTWEKVVPLRLAVKGSYPQFRRYLAALENSPYAIMIQEINMNTAGRSPNDNPDGVVSATISAQVYWIGKDAPDYASQQENND